MFCDAVRVLCRERDTAYNDDDDDDDVLKRMSVLLLTYHWESQSWEQSREASLNSVAYL